MIPDYESEMDEIFTENDSYKQEETRRSDVSMGFIKANIDLTSAEVNDFTKPRGNYIYISFFPVGIQTDTCHSYFFYF